MIEIRGNRDAVKERIAGQRGDGFFLPITEDDFNHWSGESVLFEEGLEQRQRTSLMILSASLGVNFIRLSAALARIGTWAF